jgi:hypothetical protein
MWSDALRGMYLYFGGLGFENLISSWNQVRYSRIQLIAHLRYLEYGLDLTTILRIKYEKQRFFIKSGVMNW